jgi:hypothetical protein
VTLRPLPRSRLDRVLPPLVREYTVIALVPFTNDRTWAAAAAWDVAQSLSRTAAAEGREVAVADLCVESPLLTHIDGVAASPGLVEAFAADMPLSTVVQEHAGIHVLSPGADPSAGTQLRGSARWARLRAGFRSQRALLLLCVPAEKLQELWVTPEAIIALAAPGVDLGSRSGRMLLAARERGSVLLGIVRERAASTFRLRPVLVAAGAALAIASAALLATAKESLISHDPAALAALPILPHADSGAWTLQLAAFGTPGRALAQAGRLTDAGFPTFVSPITPDASGALWYRVLIGAFPTREAAAAAREACRRLGLGDGGGALLRAPYSLTLVDPVDVARLQAAGFAALRWGTAGPVLVGAYENPEQADVAQTLLHRIGVATTVISRSEPTP